MTENSAMAIVQKARSSDKISGQELVDHLFPDFFELHGDRLGGDDPAIIGGLASFHGQPVTVIATDRGRATVEKMSKHFGSPTPSGYRKALRLMQQAAKFGRPVFCFVNTAGAYPSKSAEEAGQGSAIACNLLAAMHLKTPIITVIYGEGGSGGALALAFGDEVWMLENSTYSVVSPEGAASILWKDSTKAGLAAKIMQITPEPLLKRQVIEGIIEEPADYDQLCENIDATLQKRLKGLQALSMDDLISKRCRRFRKF